MSLIRSYLALLAILLSAAPVAAQETTSPDPATSTAPLPIQVDLDHATFAYGPEASLVEVYFAFEATSIAFGPDSLGFRARLPVEVNLRQSTQLVPGMTAESVWSDSLAIDFVVPDTSVLRPGQHFIHQVRASVPPGEYELAIRIPEDAEERRPELTMQRDVLVPDYTETAYPSVSDVALSTQIIRSDDRNNPFYKNGLIIRPNPNQLYGGDLSQVYYYAEVYDAALLAGDETTYTVLAYLAEANRPQPLEGFSRRAEREVRSPDVLVGAFDVSTLPSGAYFLRIALLNPENEAVVEQVRKFFVYNPDVQREQVVGLEATFENSPYATMPELEVQAEIGQIGVIANDRERRRARDIQDLEEQRRFLMEFWRARDPNPATPVNEFREEFFQRLQYANERYTSRRREGWETDRGRVLLKYGLPSAIDPHLYERDSAPYEVWQYNNIPGEGQALFIFADLDRFGDFQLLHSTVSGEPKMPEWQAELKRQ